MTSLQGVAARHFPILTQRLAARSARAEVRRSSARVAAVRANLRRIFPDAAEERVETWVADLFGYGYRNRLEVRGYDAMSAAQLRAHCRSSVTVRGAEHLEVALAAPNPIVLFTPHFGNYALGAVWLALAVEGRKPLLYFYDPPERNPFAPVLRRLLDKLGCNAEAIHNDRTAVRKALKGLRSGAVLTMMPDVFQYDRASLYVPMFGHFTMAMPGTAFFALKSDATLLPFYCHREPSGDVFRFDAPLALERTGNDLDDQYRLTARVVANMEQHITEQPALWAYWETIFDRLAPVARLPRDGETWEDRFRDLGTMMIAQHRGPAGFFARFEERYGARSTP